MKDNQLLDIYKFYAQTAENTTERRLKSNQFYLTLTTFLIGFLVAFAKWADATNSLAFIIIGALGLLLSRLWANNILSYKRLNEAKFKIILELEKQLPFACYTKEWDILGEGKDKKKYRLLTSVETKMPLLFGIIFGAILILGIIVEVI